MSPSWRSEFVVTEDFVVGKFREDGPIRATQPDRVEIIGQGTPRTRLAKPLIPFRDRGANSLRQRLSSQFCQLAGERFGLVVLDADRHEFYLSSTVS